MHLSPMRLGPVKLPDSKPLRVPANCYSLANSERAGAKTRCPLWAKARLTGINRAYIFGGHTSRFGSVPTRRPLRSGSSMTTTPAGTADASQHAIPGFYVPRCPLCKTWGDMKIELEEGERRLLRC